MRSPYKKRREGRRESLFLGFLFDDRSSILLSRCLTVNWIAANAIWKSTTGHREFRSFVFRDQALFCDNRIRYTRIYDAQTNCYRHFNGWTHPSLRSNGNQVDLSETIHIFHPHRKERYIYIKYEKYMLRKSWNSDPYWFDRNSIQNSSHVHTCSAKIGRENETHGKRQSIVRTRSSVSEKEILVKTGRERERERERERARILEWKGARELYIKIFFSWESRNVPRKNYRVLLFDIDSVPMKKTFYSEFS